MPKLLTTAAVQRLRPSRERLEIRDAGAPGLYLVIQTSGIKSWAMRLRRPDGRPAKLTLGKCDPSSAETQDEPVLGGALTLRQARQLANQLDRERARGIDVASLTEQRRKEERLQKANNSFADLARDFIAEHARIKNRGWRDTAKVLGLTYAPESMEPIFVRGGLAERWAKLPATEIDGHMIFSVIDEARRHAIPGMKARRAGMCDPRGRAMAAVLGKLFSWAARMRRVPANPAVGMFRPPPPTGRDRKLAETELRWLWLALDQIGGAFAGCIKLLILTGARKNEAAGMMWGELSNDLAVWELPAARTKNKKAHTVHLPPTAREILAAVPRIAGVVFSTNGKTRISGWSKIKHRIDDLMMQIARKEAKKAGRDPDLISIPPWRIHDLRRTCASGMQKLGVPAEVIERCLNHLSGSYQGVAGIYQRDPMTDAVRAALERWGAHVKGVVTGVAAVVVPMQRRGRR
jgi:integrase